MERCLLLKLLDGKVTIIYFFRTKYSLSPSKVSVVLAEIRLTKPYFDSSSLSIKQIPLNVPNGMQRYTIFFIAVSALHVTGSGSSKQV